MPAGAVQIWSSTLEARAKPIQADWARAVTPPKRISRGWSVFEDGASEDIFKLRGANFEFGAKYKLVSGKSWGLSCTNLGLKAYYVIFGL